MKKIVVLFSGSGTNLEYILEEMHGKELEVLAAVTNNPDAGGISIARKHHIPTEILDHRDFSDRESFDKELVKTVEKFSPDLTVLAGFMRILTPVFTSRIRAVNLHPSLLPRHKGLHAIERSFEDEYPEGGVSVHWVSGELDGGEIICNRTVEKRGLSFDEYYGKIRKIEKEALAEGIRAALRE